MIQGDASWLALKCGKITGSRFHAAMDVNKRTGKPNASRRALVKTLREEIATGIPEHVEPNIYMAHGKKLEPEARRLYGFMTGRELIVPAFIHSAALEYVGFSPDGIFGDYGMIEIKCPYMEARHLRTVESKCVPDEYVPQVQGGLFVTGRAWIDYCSYFPSLGIEIVRVQRDDAFIARLAQACVDVWDEVQSNNRSVA